MNEFLATVIIAVFMFTLGLYLGQRRKQFKFTKMGALVVCEGMSQELVEQLIEVLKEKKE